MEKKERQYNLRGEILRCYIIYPESFSQQHLQEQWDIYTVQLTKLLERESNDGVNHTELE